MIMSFVIPLVVASTSRGHPSAIPILKAKAMVERSISKINWLIFKSMAPVLPE